MSKLFTIVLLIYIAFATCKKKQDSGYLPEDKSGIPDEIQLLEVSKWLFKEEFREAKIEKTPDGVNLFIEYGGKSALSFRKAESYEIEMKFMTAFYIWKFVRATEKRPIHLLTISLVKPFYVRDESLKKELIEDFEVFRVSIDPSLVKKLEYYKTDDFSPILDINSNTDLRVILLGKLITTWKVELNEFRRVELK